MMRAAFVDYIRSGHGLVVVHAGSAGFYELAGISADCRRNVGAAHRTWWHAYE